MFDKKKIVWTTATIALVGLWVYYAFIKKSDGVPYGWIGFAAGFSFFAAVQAYQKD